MSIHSQKIYMFINQNNKQSTNVDNFTLMSTYVISLNVLLKKVLKTKQSILLHSRVRLTYVFTVHITDTSISSADLNYPDLIAS